jgi:hypothetical protein
VCAISTDCFATLSARFAGLFWREFMGMPALMGYLAAFAGYLALLLCIHGRKPAP